MPGFWRKCRIAFRCVRFAVWLLVLAVLLAFVWFNRVGLPDFLKTRLVANLSERGVKLEFSRMRLSLVHGLVAENVRAGQTQSSDSPVFTAQEVQLQLNYPALWHRQWQVDGLMVRDGRFTLPLPPASALTLTNLQTELRFLAGDTWALDHFRADFAGAQIGISGELAHAPEVLNWNYFAGRNPDHSAFIAALNNFSDTLRQIHFQGEPQLRLALSGDARDPHTIVVWLSATAAGVNTPWFVAHDFMAEANLTAPASAPTNAAAAWGFWTNLQPFRLAWTLRLGALHAESLDASAIRCAGVWAAPTLAITNLTAQFGGGGLSAGGALDVAAREVNFTADARFDWHAVTKLLPANVRGPLAEISWPQPPVLRGNGFVRLPPWTSFADGWRSDRESSVSWRGDLAFTNAVVRRVKLDEVRASFAYAERFLDLPDLTVVQGRTRLRLSGEESVATENFHGLLTGQLAEASVAAYLTNRDALAGLQLLACQEPLALTLDVSGNLRTLATLSATGRVALTNFAIRGQAMDSVAGTFCYTNLAADIFAPELLRANGAQWLKADRLFLDLRRLALWITNGWSTADPVPITRAIGPKTAGLMEPYHFLTPPLVRVTGSVPVINILNPHDAEYADLTFEIIRGVPFQWAKLSATNVTGTIRWRQQSLLLTNIVAQLYDGSGAGSGDLDFRPPTHACDYNFSFAVTNINLHLLASEMSTNQNTLEGRLSGEVTVTNASSADWHSWNGGGDAQVHDGVLWDVPIFAFMSPVLNTVSPGLGNSRAKEAAAAFVITNGVIFTDSLLIRSLTMRLQYSGTVDLDQNVNARVTAQLLRNVPVVGTLVSTVLMPVSKIFECRVTGPLSAPVVAPVYIPGFIPKLLLVPLHPIRTLEEIFTPGPVTNAPARPAGGTRP
jgi:hypothetical protein